MRPDVVIDRSTWRKPQPFSESEVEKENRSADSAQMRLRVIDASHRPLPAALQRQRQRHAKRIF